jgi:hypothetical protein
MQVGFVVAYAMLMIGTAQARALLDAATVALLVVGFVWSHLEPVDRAARERGEPLTGTIQQLARFQAWLKSQPQQHSLLSALVPTSTLLYADVVVPAWTPPKLPMLVYGVTLAVFNSVAVMAANMLSDRRANWHEPLRRAYWLSLAALWAASVAAAFRLSHLVLPLLRAGRG